METKEQFLAYYADQMKVLNGPVSQMELTAVSYAYDQMGMYPPEAHAKAIACIIGADNGGDQTLIWYWTGALAICESLSKQMQVNREHYVWTTYLPGDGVEPGSKEHFIFMWNEYVPDSGLQVDDQLSRIAAAGLLRNLQMECVMAEDTDVLNRVMPLPPEPKWPQLCWALDDTIFTFLST